MRAYSEWFAKSVTVVANIPVASRAEQDVSVISGFLARQGYRAISSTETAVHAVRGRKIWTLINVGDPRRNFHTTDVSFGPDNIEVKTEVDSWFGMGTEHDKAVFAAEIKMLSVFLQTRELSAGPLAEAQGRRRASDLKSFLIVVGIGIMIGICMIAVTLLTKR